MEPLISLVLLPIAIEIRERYKEEETFGTKGARGKKKSSHLPFKVHLLM
jgi:hypothetical protein